MTRGHPVNSKRVLTEFPTAGRQPACYRRSARVRQFASKNPCFLPRTPSIYAGFKPIFVNPCNGTFVVYGLNESIT